MCCDIRLNLSGNLDSKSNGGPIILCVDIFPTVYNIGELISSCKDVILDGIGGKAFRFFFYKFLFVTFPIYKYIVCIV